MRISQNYFVGLRVNQDSDGNRTGIHNIVSVARFSSVGKLVAVTAYVLRYIHNSRKPRTLLNGPLTAIELDSARKLWISSSQSTCYPKETGFMSSSSETIPTEFGFR